MDVKDEVSKERIAGQVQSGESIAEPAGTKTNSRKRSITIFVVVSILNVALLALLWTQLLTPAQNVPSASTNDSALIGGDINSPLVGRPAPDFTLPALNSNGGQVHLSAFKGKPVVLNFWASWCDPCTAEAPFLQKAWQTRLQPQGMAFIGIDAPEKPGDAPTFLQKHGITYTNVQDTLDGATAIKYGVTQFPETVFINRQGIVVAKYLGALNERDLQLELKKLAR